MFPIHPTMAFCYCALGNVVMIFMLLHFRFTNRFMMGLALWGIPIMWLCSCAFIIADCIAYGLAGWSARITLTLAILMALVMLLIVWCVREEDKALQR